MHYLQSPILCGDNARLTHGSIFDKILLTKQVYSRIYLIFVSVFTQTIHVANMILQQQYLTKLQLKTSMGSS